DTPGAKAAKAGACAIKLIEGCEPLSVRCAFVRWLSKVDRDAHKYYGGDFMSCSPSQRTMLLSHFEYLEPSKSFIHRARVKLWGIDGLELMKKYTAIGYFTSMQGATQTLVYEMVPGHYEACMAMKENQ